MFESRKNSGAKTEIFARQWMLVVRASHRSEPTSQTQQRVVRERLSEYGHSSRLKDSPYFGERDRKVEVVQDRASYNQVKFIVTVGKVVGIGHRVTHLRPEPSALSFCFRDGNRFGRYIEAGD